MELGACEPPGQPFGHIKLSSPFWSGIGGYTLLKAATVTLAIIMTMAWSPLRTHPRGLWLDGNMERLCDLSLRFFCSVLETYAFLLSVVFSAGFPVLFSVSSNSQACLTGRGMARRFCLKGFRKAICGTVIIKKSPVDLSLCQPGTWLISMMLCCPSLEYHVD